jgi:AcrR family transcriptional regulator
VTDKKRDKRTNARDRLVAAADGMVHVQGFKHTSLADIARAAGVPLGNVYYYFKTKEDIGQAVIARRAGHYCGLCEQWEQLADPRARLRAFIQMTIDNRELLARSGCPIGSLCQELHKEGGPLAERAGAMFTVLLAWLAAQFHLLGKGDESSDLALHLLSALEGASLLTHTFRSPDLMLRETTRLQNWLASL